MRSIAKRCALLLLLAATSTASAQMGLEPAFPNLTFTRPVDLQHDGSGRLFVVEQQGLIRSFANQGTTSATDTFLDIRDRVRTIGNEEGLLGLAFHPQY